MTTPIPGDAPAFPHPGTASPGMSLRDYFIVAVQPPSDISRAWGEMMVRTFPNDDRGEDLPWCREVALWWADVEAAWRVIHADAILRARQR